ncbi:MAG: hypothetical protein ABIT70_02865 [Sulfuriferula sp.]|jgi:hypothetical protein
MAYLLDYIKSRWAPKGSVVTAGVPPETRVDHMPVSRALVACHLAASLQLPQGEATETAIFMALSDPLFLQTGPRGLAQQLIGAGLNADLEPLVKLLTVLTQEITRRMYIEAASQRSEAIGIRLFPLHNSTDAAIQTLCGADAHGLGTGVYPFTAVPDNPMPGQTCGFYIRVVTQD